MQHPSDEAQHRPRQTRRIALIMTNSFSGINGADRKEAANYDHAAMLSLWKDHLNCEISPNSGKDLSAEEMRRALKNLSQTREDYQYMAVVISTHGGLVAKSFAIKTATVDYRSDPANAKTIGYQAFKEYVNSERKGELKNQQKVPVFFGDDFCPVQEKEMKEMFQNDSATGLQDVPKIFILNYCRGDMIDYGVIRVPKPAQTLSTGFGSLQSDVGNRNIDLETSPASLMPLVSDVVAMYATQYSTTAFQYDPDFGSWLISSIERVFKENAVEKDLVEMMTDVNREMKQKTTTVTDETGTDKNVKAMSIFESSLTKKLFLKEE